MTDYYIQLESIDIDGDSDTDPIEYHFELISNVDEDGNIPFTAIEADTTLNNQQLGFSGKTRELPIQWTIKDGSNNSNLLDDKSDGTWSNQLPAGFDDHFSNDTIVTTEEQIHYLQRYIQNSTLGAQWKLFGGIYTDPDGDGTDEGTPVVVQRLSIRRLNPSLAQASIQLKIGEGV